MPSISSWHSYPSSYNIGHREVAEIFSVPVIVEEKIDGSQFSWGVFEGEDFPRTLKVRSKGAQLYVEAPEKMFTKAVETAKTLADQAHVGWTYRCEYLQKPKHNTLCYARVPAQHLILFDINTGEESYLSYEEKAQEALRLGLEIVPKLYEGMVTSPEQLREFLSLPSILGGPTIEGVVIKPVGHVLIGRDKKALMAKFVSEAFKESHGKEWKTSNPGQGDILELIGEAYRTPARWHKALQHLREEGKIEDSPRDIGLLMKEVGPDIEKECEGEIKEALWKWAWPHIRRKVVAGLPEWYKETLLSKQFEEDHHGKSEEE